MADVETLLPCPFCGEQAIYHSTVHDRVKCSNFDCWIHGSYFSIEGWNTRAALQGCRVEWECFCDEAYFHQWAVRPKGENRWGYCFHVPTEDEAKGLCELLNGALLTKEG